MRVFVRQGRNPRIGQAEKSDVKRISSAVPVRRPRSDGTTAGSVFIYVVTERRGHEHIDHDRTEKLIGNCRIPLLAHIGAITRVQVEKHSAVDVFAPRLLLPIVELGNLALRQSPRQVCTRVK